MVTVHLRESDVYRRTPRLVRAARMGVILNSRVLIAAKREQRPVSRLPSSLEAGNLKSKFPLTSISAMESV